MSLVWRVAARNLVRESHKPAIARCVRRTVPAGGGPRPHNDVDQGIRPETDNDRASRDQDGSTAAAAAFAAAGSASKMRLIAVSSCAAETNQASKTDGGSEIPALSMAWKKGG